MIAHKPNLVVLIGLPGSGKSRYLQELQQSGAIAPECTYDDYHADAEDNSCDVERSKHYQSLVNNLKSGKDCAVADIAFCDNKRLACFTQKIVTALDNSVNIKPIYFENAPQACKRNVRRNNDPSLGEKRIEKIEEFAKNYEPPPGAKVIKVYGRSEPAR